MNTAGTDALAGWQVVVRRTIARPPMDVFSMVTDTNAVAAVTRGPDGILAGLGPGKVYIDMTTASPGNSHPYPGNPFPGISSHRAMIGRSTSWQA